MPVHRRQRKLQVDLEPAASVTLAIRIPPAPINHDLDFTTEILESGMGVLPKRVVTPAIRVYPTSQFIGTDGRLVPLRVRALRTDFERLRDDEILLACASLKRAGDISATSGSALVDRDIIACFASQCGSPHANVSSYCVDTLSTHAPTALLRSERMSLSVPRVPSNGTIRLLIKAWRLDALAHVRAYAPQSDEDRRLMALYERLAAGSANESTLAALVATAMSERSSAGYRQAALIGTEAAILALKNAYREADDEPTRDDLAVALRQIFPQLQVCYVVGEGWDHARIREALEHL